MMCEHTEFQISQRTRALTRAAEKDAKLSSWIPDQDESVLDSVGIPCLVVSYNGVVSYYLFGESPASPYFALTQRFGSIPGKCRTCEMNV